METLEVEDVVIVGGGVAGLATSLGLHRLGIRSLVLESAHTLRASGFAFVLWANAWRALDALGVGHILRHQHPQLTGVITTSVESGLVTSDAPFGSGDVHRNDLEVRCVSRKLLLEAIENEIPRGTVRYSSKVERVESEDGFPSIHLANGTILKTKVLIGCDGVNSMVAKFLGFSRPPFKGQSEVRGLANYENGHGFEPKLKLFLGNGVRYGVMPCDSNSLYWFFPYSPSPNEKDTYKDTTELKQFILSKLGKVDNQVREVFERTDVTNILFSPVRFRNPWDLVWGNISKDSTCIAGDALHPMAPDMAQGACLALEDSIILARALAKALKEKTEIKKGLEEYGRERRWRSIDLIITSYLMGFLLQRNGVMMKYIRDKVLAKFLAGIRLKKARFDCGELTFC